MPRARLRTEDGATTERRIALVQRYQSRSERVDATVLGVTLKRHQYATDKWGAGATTAKGCYRRTTTSFEGCPAPRALMARTRT